VTTDCEPMNLFDFEAAARERLPKAEYDYVGGGASDESCGARR